MALAYAGDLILLVDAAGIILGSSIGLDKRSMPAIQWRGRPITSVLTEESWPKLDRLLADAGTSEIRRARELNHLDAGVEIPVRYMAFKSGDRYLLVGKDLRPVADLQRKLVAAQLALEKDYEKFRHYESRYRLLLETSREALVVTGMESGRIQDLNGAAARLLGAPAEGLAGELLSAEFEGRSRDDFTMATAKAAETGERQTCQVRTRRGYRALTVEAQLFRAGGQAMFLLRLGSDEAPDAPSSEFGAALAGLFHKGGDAIVFTDASGVIERANEAFLNLVDAALPREVQGVSFADFLDRPGVDLPIMMEQASRTGRLSGFGARLRTRFGAEVSVNISITQLPDAEPGGFALVIRDLARAVGSREPAPAIDGEAMQNVIDLVGSAPLKELVAATSDVVERMCIETAIHLTNNNRAAAAEMLGLSRQSLYVKLRKHNLIGRGDES